VFDSLPLPQVPNMPADPEGQAGGGIGPRYGHNRDSAYAGWGYGYGYGGYGAYGVSVRLSPTPPPCTTTLGEGLVLSRRSIPSIAASDPALATGSPGPSSR
jgi:hypothetical protein